MKVVGVVLVASMTMAWAIPRRGLSSDFSKIPSISDTAAAKFTTPIPIQSLALNITDIVLPASLNKAAHLARRNANKQARDEEFDCSGVKYFVPEIDVECVVTKRVTKASWYYKLDVKVQPAGLAYGKHGLDLWYNHFLTSFLDGWDRDIFEDAIGSPADWQETWGYEEVGENNWGWGLWVETSEMDSDKVKNDPHIEQHLAEHLERIIPEAI